MPQSTPLPAQGRTVTAPECPLTPRELDVLRLAEHDTSVAEIARRIRLAAAVTKLGVATRAEALRTALNMGTQRTWYGRTPTEPGTVQPSA